MKITKCDICGKSEDIFTTTILPVYIARKFMRTRIKKLSLDICRECLVKCTNICYDQGKFYIRENPELKATEE